VPEAIGTAYPEAADAASHSCHTPGVFCPEPGSIPDVEELANRAAGNVLEEVDGGWNQREHLKEELQRAEGGLKDLCQGLTALEVEVFRGRAWDKCNRRLWSQVLDKIRQVYDSCVMQRQRLQDMLFQLLLAQLRARDLAGDPTLPATGSRVGVAFGGGPAGGGQVS
jgi:hypothetical protein